MSVHLCLPLRLFHCLRVCHISVVHCCSVLLCLFPLIHAADTTWCNTYLLGSFTQRGSQCPIFTLCTAGLFLDLKSDIHDTWLISMLFLSLADSEKHQSHQWTYSSSGCWFFFFMYSYTKYDIHSIQKGFGWIKGCRQWQLHIEIQMCKRKQNSYTVLSCVSGWFACHVRVGSVTFKLVNSFVGLGF